MSIKDLLGYHLIETKEFTFTVYHLLMVILILLVTKAILWIVRRIFNRATSRKSIDQGSSHAIFQIIRYLLWIVAITIILETVGIKITFLLASSAALLVGLGLGLQNIFQDILSGVVLLFEGTVRVGDIVEIEDKIVGKVKQIGLRTSLIETRDNIIMVVPNSKFINDRVINWSHLEKRTRFFVAVGVKYGSDVDLVKKVLLECATKNREVSQKPAPIVMFYDFGNSSLDFRLYFWTNNSFWVELIKSDLRFSIDEAFRKNNIQIPFPQRDVHLKRE